MKSISMILLALAATSPSISFAFGDHPDCELGGQFVVDAVRDKPAMLMCSNYMGLGLMARPFNGRELLDSLDKYKNDPQFLKAMISLGVGRNYDEMKIGIIAAGGAVVLNGDGKPDDLANLNYVAGKVNDANGITAAVDQKNKRQKAASDDQKKRDSTPIELSPKTLTDAAQNNSAIESSLTPANCSGKAGQENTLKIFKIHFADGENGILLPSAVAKTGDNEYQFEAQLYGTAIGGMQVGPGLIKRALRFENGKAIWVGPDGKQYPIQMATQMTATEALGFARDPGPGGPDSCVYARAFKSNAPQLQLAPPTNGGKVN